MECPTIIWTILEYHKKSRIFQNFKKTFRNKIIFLKIPESCEVFYRKELIILQNFRRFQKLKEVENISENFKIPYNFQEYSKILQNILWMLKEFFNTLLLKINLFLEYVFELLCILEYLNIKKIEFKIIETQICI